MTNPRFRRGDPPARKPTEEDKRQARVMAAGVAAFTEALRPLLAGNPHRLLRTIQQHEAEGVVAAVIGACAAARETEALAEELSDPVSDLFVI